MSKGKLSLGDVVLLSRGSSNIGVVRYIGPLKGHKEDFIGVELHEGNGECNGTFQGISYFKCLVENKGVFVPVSEIKKIITPEELLTKVMVINKKFKGANAEISKLRDDLKFSQDKEQQARKDLLAMRNTEPELKISETDDDVKRFLAKEMGKKWYIGFHDLCTKYKTRDTKELNQIYQKVDKKFMNLPSVAHHSRIVYTVASSKLDNLIATGSDDKSIRLWRINYEDTSLRCIAKLESRSCINSLAFSPDGTRVAAALDSGWIELYDIATGKNEGALEGQSTSEVWTIAFSPDGNQLISGSLDRSVRIWNVKQRDCSWALRGHDEWVNGVAVAPNGTSIVSCSGDKTVKVWDTRNMNCKSTLRGHTDFVRSVCVLQDSKTVVSASDDGFLRVWDLDTNAVSAISGHEKGIYSVSEGPGSLVCSASRDQTVRVWDVGKKQLTHTFHHHGGDVNSCCFVGRGAEYIASGSDDKTVQIAKLQKQEGQHRQRG